MAGVKISNLPAVPVAPQLNDIFAEVQPAVAGTTYKVSFQQLLDLFNANIEITESQVTNLVADLASKLNLSGGTMSGVLNMGTHFITNVVDPVNPQDAATKAYVDSAGGAFLPLAGGTMAGIINMGNHKITNVTDPSSAQDAATKNYVDTSVGSYLPLAGGTMSGVINMGSHNITNVTDPANPQDAATKAYVDTFLSLTGGTMSGVINMGNNKITHMADPSSAQDAVTLNYLNTQLANYLALSGGTMTGVINMNSHKITSLTDPTNPQDAATKNYVDSVATGFTVKQACAEATTANLNATYSNGASGIGATLTNAGALTALTIDGVSVSTNDRVLVKNQTSTLQNGIYTVTTVGSGAVAWVLTRATDFDQPSEIQPGDLVIINNGTVNAGTSWLQTATVSAVGTDPILFSQFTFSASAVLLKANNLSDVASTVTSFNNISPITTKGDLISSNGSNNVRVAVGGSDGQMLRVKAAATTGFAWSTATYPDTTTANQILYSSSTNTVAGISSTAGGVLVTDASSVPQFLANPSATGKILQSVNGAISAWSTPTYPSGSGSAGKVIISDGTNNIYSTPTFPNTSPAAGKLLFGDGTNWIVSTPTYPNASATTRKIIVSDGTNFVASTETWAVPGASGNILTSDGTNWTSAAPAFSSPLTTKGDLFTYTTTNARLAVGSTNGQMLQVSSGAASGLAWSTATYPSTIAINQLLYGSATNVVSALATANSSVLGTDGSGNISWLTTLPSGLAATNLTLTTPILGTPQSGTLTNCTGYTVANLSDSAWTDISGSISVTGCSGSPTIAVARAKLIGKTYFINLQVSGTSNATTFTITGMPKTAAATMVGPIMTASNNTAAIFNGSWLISTSGTTITMTVGQSASGWTASGTKAANIMGFYETT